jgi:sugar diacid utilization regulator
MIKVREILGIFGEYGFTLLTGEAGLDNKVASVSVLELDASKQNPMWFVGNELALSTLQSFQSVESVMEGVRLLASRGVAALGIHQGAGASVIDSRIIETANLCGFPLFTVPRQVPYSIIFTGVYERIFSEQMAEMLKSEEMNIRKRAVAEAEDRMKGDLYSGLLDGTAGAGERLSARASKLGIPTQVDYCVAELCIRFAQPGCRDGDKLADGIERILESARQGLKRLHDKNAVIAKSDGCFMVLHLTRNAPPSRLEEDIETIFARMKDAAAKLPSCPDIFMGVGVPQDSLLRVALSGEQAGRALRLGIRIARGQGVFYYGKMGVYSLLDAGGMEDFNANCARELSEIYRICGQNADTYLDTLEAYFDFGETMTAAAKNLDIHVNTVKYRINKLKEAVCEDVFRDGREKLRLYLLIKMRKLV